MARVQLVIPDKDRDRFVHQARREGMSLSAWLRAAAEERLRSRQQVVRFQCAEDVGEFFTRCDVQEGGGAEPDWQQHLEVISRSRGKGAAPT